MLSNMKNTAMAMQYYFNVSYFSILYWTELELVQSSAEKNEKYLQFYSTTMHKGVWLCNESHPA